MSGTQTTATESEGRMQNRTNRNLLFGARAPGAEIGSNGEGEALEADNQQSLEHLRGSAGTMKDIALQVDASVNDQNRVLDRMVSRAGTKASI